MKSVLKVITVGTGLITIAFLILVIIIQHNMIIDAEAWSGGYKLERDICKNKYEDLTSSYDKLGSEYKALKEQTDGQ